MREGRVERRRRVERRGTILRARQHFPDCGRVGVSQEEEKLEEHVCEAGGRWAYLDFLNTFTIKKRARRRAAGKEGRNGLYNTVQSNAFRSFESAPSASSSSDAYHRRLRIFNAAAAAFSFSFKLHRLFPVFSSSSSSFSRSTEPALSMRRFFFLNSERGSGGGGSGGGGGGGIDSRRRPELIQC